MRQEIINSHFAGKRLLVAPLDWGLGHATRCIPLVKSLLGANARLWLAGEGAQETLLRNEFPQLPFLQLPGYRVKYSRKALAVKLLFQWPGLRRSVRMEQAWLDEKINEYGFEVVISDNRFGLHHSRANCIFLTHQLRIRTGWGRLADGLAQKINYKYINQFNECWVPDLLASPGLAGDLSHPGNLPAIPTRYIGVLSRFNKNGSAQYAGNRPQILPDSNLSPHILVLLSGPEPQRTILENIIIDQVVKYRGSATILRGLPGEQTILPSTNSIQFYNHLPTGDLEKELQRAEWVIARSGYSTIMDLAALGKKSILIPTPGQSEQEYLGRHLVEIKKAFCTRQKSFNLIKALNDAKNFNYSF